MEEKKDEKSFSLGRLDIVDLYEWKNSNKLVYQTYFQRQFVWREKDKRDLIDTIMKGFPIPAIFICDAGTDFANLSKRYNVLDGRQRLESIFEFLENQYTYDNKYFKDFTDDEKKKILNYNITLIQMYIDPDDTAKIKEIFKRLNKNAYNLNKMEKQSTQLVEYDYMIIAKIVSGIVQFENIESYLEEIHDLFSDDEESDGTEITEYSEMEKEAKEIPDDVKKICKWDNIKYINEILTSDIVFTSYDRQRQVALQYFLNVFSCILKEEMINRNVSEKTIIALSDISKDLIGQKLIECNKACEKLIDVYEGVDPFWKNKTSFFTLCYVLTINKSQRDAAEISDLLDAFQKSNSDDWQQYYEASNQGVNDKKVRELRVEMLSKVLK
jgi:hypothetical protein